MNKDFMNEIKVVLWDTTIESENMINQLKREMDLEIDNPQRQEELSVEINELEQGIDELKRISSELETALNSQILRIDNYKKSSLVDSNINYNDKSNLDLVDEEELENAEVNLEEEETVDENLISDELIEEPETEEVAEEQEEMVVEEPVEAVELPTVEEAVVEEPTAEVEAPAVEEAVAEEPTAEVEVPAVEEAVAEEPTAEVEVPAVEEAVAEEPTAEVEVPAVEETVVEQPTAEVEVPAVEEAVVEEPTEVVEVPKVEEVVAEQPTAEVEVPKVEENGASYQKTSITEDRGVLVSTAQASKARESFDNQNVLQAEISRKSDENAPAVEIPTVEQSATPVDTPAVEESAPATLSSEEELERMTQEYTEALTSGDEQKANELSNAISEKSKTLQKNN